MTKIQLCTCRREGECSFRSTQNQNITTKKSLRILCVFIDKYKFCRSVVLVLIPFFVSFQPSNPALEVMEK